MSTTAVLEFGVIKIESEGAGQCTLTLNSVNGRSYNRITVPIEMTRGFTAGEDIRVTVTIEPIFEE